MACPRCGGLSGICPGPDCPACALDCNCGGGAESPGPAHYRKGGIEPIDFILSNPHLGYCEANVIKYVFRWREKDGLRDLQKAVRYLEILMAREEKSDASRS